MSEPKANGVRTALKLLLVNIVILLAMLIPVELIFGTWVRPVGMRDLRRFSIPIDVRYEFDTSKLYPSDRPRSVYTRDAFGLRGAHGTLDAIDVLTVGGSTTEQRYLDDELTWQSVAEKELRARGLKLRIANAGVDGQSTVGIAFNFDNWFPLLKDLHPKVVVFYVGVNDVLRRRDRDAYDRALDTSSWRFRSAVFQLFQTARSNLRARAVGVTHGRRPDNTAATFTDVGLLAADERAEMSEEIVGTFLANVDGLRQRAERLGQRAVFMTQTAYAWHANRRPARGVNGTLTLLGRTVNYVDVSAIHQELNRRLIEYCHTQRSICLDLANEVEFDDDDYYDFLHNTPKGAEKIGKYLAERLATLEPLAALVR